MAAYADYQYYTTTYGGTAIPQACWGPLALIATAKVNELTFGRISDITDDVKNAVCQVAEIVHQGDVVSESLGDMSKTYANKTVEQKCYAAVNMWLGRIGLTYAGVD
jgi:hypothetical protein